MKKFKAHILIVDDDDRIRELVKQYLNNNDSYNFFNELNDLIITDLTGTNVMDLTLLIII